MLKKHFLIISLIILNYFHCFSWGFFAHQLINQLAVFSLPPEMISFYKSNIDYIQIHAVDPDKRRLFVKKEESYHFIDVDEYDTTFLNQNMTWNNALNIYGEEKLLAHGIVPWRILQVKWQLTNAFRDKDSKQILKLSADLGHYIADANVPLHTTKNYNGQLTNQNGIHALWESRLPELFCQDYNLFVGKAIYIESGLNETWKAIHTAHQLVDSVLLLEKIVTEKMTLDKKYTFEEKNAQLVKVYSFLFCEKYHQILQNQIEEQMRASIRMVASFWYSCWIDAGQPDLSSFDKEILISINNQEEKELNDSTKITNLRIEE